MANAITQMVASTTISTLNLISPNARSKLLPPSVDPGTASLACNGSSSDASVYPKPSSLRTQRRTIAWGIAGAVLGLKVGEESAMAAKRVPPAPVEKNDPNVSGVLAKVLASRRRKEAMKEAMAKQRERGKPIEQ